MDDYNEQLNKWRLLAGVRITAEHGKRRQPEQTQLQENEQLDEQRSNPSVDAVVRSIKQIADIINDEMEKSQDSHLDEMYKQDKNAWLRILQLIRRGERQQAARMFRNMDTEARHYSDKISKKGDRTALLKYLGVTGEIGEVNKYEEPENLGEQQDQNRQDTTDQGDQSGMQEWKSYNVTLRTDNGTRTELVSARSKSEAKQRARQQAPDGSHISGEPQMTTENSNNQQTFQVGYTDNKGKEKTKKVKANDKEEAKARVERDRKGKYRNINYAKALNEEGAGGQSSYQITYNDGNQQKTQTVTAGNKAGARRKGPSGKRVTKVEELDMANEAHNYTDAYPSHEDDEDASINVVDYDDPDGTDASTNAPNATKTEIPQQTFNRGEASSEDQDTQVKVPSSITKELKDAVDEFRAEAERLENRGGSTAKENRMFYTDTADAFEDILGYLQLDSIEGIKQAQIYASKLMGPMLHKLPTNTWKFIQRGGPNRSLKSYMGKVDDTFPITGPRNTIDDG